MESVSVKRKERGRNRLFAQQRLAQAVTRDVG